jgi:hypothetical protein
LKFHGVAFGACGVALSLGVAPGFGDVLVESEPPPRLQLFDAMRMLSLVRRELRHQLPFLRLPSGVGGILELTLGVVALVFRADGARLVLSGRFLRGDDPVD